MDVAFETTTDLDAAEALARGQHGDPFAFLGPHRVNGVEIVRVLVPGAHAVDLVTRETGVEIGTLTPLGSDGIFAGPNTTGRPYLLRIHWPDAIQETEDPYGFPPLLGEIDLYLFSEGKHFKLAERLGANPTECEGVAGIGFAVWAPNARRVSVIGDFNSWDRRRHPMRLRHGAGVWEIFIPRLTVGARYKFAILGPDGHELPDKADPLARQSECPPDSASIVAARPDYPWTDATWIKERAERQNAQSPIAIYEVHAASWLRPADAPNSCLDWDALADRLIPYVAELGFTHVELMPIMGHPFAGSWGYQPLSQFAPSARFGDPAGLARFVDAAHGAGIGVILDWVPAHFPNDTYGLIHFDGTALYEHADPREGFHQDWNTVIYNLGRTEVAGFLLASAMFWLETFHVDGIRVDAVASMLYRDYSRRAGEWIPNCFGGRENLEAIAFFRRLNKTIAERCPGAMTLAEESTAWPGVTAPELEGGLGFSFKWNMGWMHDTLRYLGEDPLYRRWHHNEMTFGLVYAFSERFVLPLSHDEVVYGKGSLYTRAPGDPWQKLANLRAYFTFMWTHPGKKLLFMGDELAQPHEWSHDGEVDWGQLENPPHAGLQRLVADLNRLYRTEPALYETDADPAGFEWIIGDDTGNSVFAWLRKQPDGPTLLVILNMTPVPRDGYCVGVPRAGFWREIFNSDAGIYGGSDHGNPPGADTTPQAAHGHPQALRLNLPPLGALIFKHGA
jgi:1,4-alpha-glucan branching enzyme